MFRPLGDRVVVKREQIEEQLKNGIYVLTVAQEKPIQGIQGTVVSVSNGVWREDGKIWPINVSVGDKVLFGKYSGIEVKLDGDDVLIMREEEILGVL